MATGLRPLLLLEVVAELVAPTHRHHQPRITHRRKASTTSSAHMAWTRPSRKTARTAVCILRARATAWAASLIRSAAWQKKWAPCDPCNEVRVAAAVQSVRCCRPTLCRQEDDWQRHALGHYLNFPLLFPRAWGWKHLGTGARIDSAYVQAHVLRDQKRWFR